MNATSEALADLRKFMTGKHMPNRLDPTFVRAQIEALRLTHPGIWDEGDETLLLALESETNLHEFLTRVVDVMDEAEEMVGGIEVKMKNRQARKARFEQRYQAMRTLARKLMDQAGIRKVVLPNGTLSIRAGSPRTIITDEAALPDDCVVIKRVPVLNKIKELIKDGVPVPGAEISNSEPTLHVTDK